MADQDELKAQIEAGVESYEGQTLLEKLEATKQTYVEAENDEMAEFMDELIRRVKAEKLRVRRNAQRRRDARKRQKQARKRNRR